VDLRSPSVNRDIDVVVVADARRDVSGSARMRATRSVGAIDACMIVVRVRSKNLPTSAAILVMVAAGCSSTLGGPDGVGGTGQGHGGAAGKAGGAAGNTGGSGGGDGGAVGAGRSCRANSDCVPYPGQYLYCANPVEDGCRVCSTTPDPCQSDSDCRSDGGDDTSICQPTTCPCHWERSCVPGCASDDQCATGLACGADHHCAPRACSPTGPMACPVNFTCAPDGHCARTPCSSDADCSGACVEGACYDQPGTCVEAIL
jgi:hypothetical protein